MYRKDKLGYLGASDNMEGESELLPVFSTETEDEIEQENIPDELPVLPLRNAVLFPGVLTPITVGREKSLTLIKAVNNNKDKLLGAITQKDNSIEDPKLDDLEKVGTVARVVKILNMPDGTTTVIIQGRKRFALNSIITYEPYHIGSVKPLANAQKPGNQKNFEAVLESLKDISLQIIKKSSHIPPEAAFTIENIDSPNYLVNYICYNLDLDVDSKQQLLELDNIEERAEKALVYLSKEMQLLELKNQIQNKVKTDIDKQQRDYFLNQQLKTIKEELGDATNEQEIEELKQRARSKNWTEAVAEVFNKELSKLQRMNPVAMEYSIQLNYLDTLVSLPWGEYSKDRFDLKYAQKVLDRDHYGLEKVKERIVEYLAVLKLKNNMKSPIICLVGPPGVGKTSLGKSIAEALGRKYIRMSLGGLHDEAEIRGHRKTYIGAMPGRIIQNIKKAGTSNPVFVLDEIDKVSGATVNGDPSSALLEVLDPEQNMSFHDNFLEVDYDLSHVMFLATANTINSIHPALRDRMEVVDVSGYLLEEKYNIARKHLVPKQLKEHGILAGKVTFRKPVLEKIIENYTRESGVRNLEKTIAQLIRNQAVNIVMDKNYKKDITDEDLIKILGPARFQRNRAVENHLAGVATGLAWTAVGGEILFVEVSLSKGKGNFTLTGNLGAVMKESATLAFQYLKSHAPDIGVNPEIFDKWNVHIHVPEGATPKDGPSAGITLFAALASAFSQRRVKSTFAMTGEITLRGKVLPVGGIKEKILAAKRAKINNIILPADNEKDINDINERYIKGLTFHYVEELIELPDLLLVKEKVKDPLNLNA